MKVGDFYGFPLKDTLYQIKDTQKATMPQSICFIAFEFNVIADLSEEVTIFTDKTGTRGVTISKSSLNILGTDPLSLEYTGWAKKRSKIKNACVEKVFMIFQQNNHSLFCIISALISPKMKVK